MKLRQTRPSTIVGEVAVACPREARADFLLTDEAIIIKRQILDLLG